MTNKKTLFLDFDGVLHPFPATAAERFMHVPRFEHVMGQFPDWQIVISSYWRRYESLQGHRDHFSAALAQRIVGVTPFCFDLQDISQEMRPFLGEVECLAWLDANGGREQTWLAVDDWPTLFSPGCPHLFLVDGITGLDDRQAELLAQRLRQY